MRSYVPIVCGLLLAAIAPRATAANVNEFIDFSLRNESNFQLLPGRLYVPPPAADPSPRPFILFLHGAGESGSGNVAQVNRNLDNLLAEAKRRGAFLYAPQTDSGWAGSTVLTRTMAMIDRAISEQQVDPNRIYVTGLSMGGGGVWNMLTSYPDRFAAAVPICPVSPSPFVASNLVGQPIWDFHARNDTTVSVNSSRDVISGILSAAGQPLPEYPPLTIPFLDFQHDNDSLDLHYTEFRFGGHGIWSQVYLRADMYDWMFAHSLVPEPSTFAILAISVAGFVVICSKSRVSLKATPDSRPLPRTVRFAFPHRPAQRGLARGI